MTDYSNLFTSRGCEEMEHFTLVSLPAGGLTLRCTWSHADPAMEQSWDWPAHVAAPTLIHIVTVAQTHADAHAHETELL